MLGHRAVGWLVLAVLVLPTAAWAAGGGAPRQRDVTGTWLDAFNFLDLIPGPSFLWLFIVYAGLLMVALKLLAAWRLSRVEGASLLDLEAQVRFELKPTYLELAYLRGGNKAAVEAALCNLHRLGVVSAYLSARPGRALAGALRQLNGLERAVAAACESGIAAHAVINERRVVRALADFEVTARHKLQGVGLLAARPTHVTALAAMVAAFLLVEGLGVIRLARSVMRGYTNVGLLVVLLAAAAPVIFFVFKPWLTQAGKKYLQQMKAEYRVLARQVQARTHAWDAPDVVYAVAACGAAAFGGTGYQTIQQAMQPPRQSGSNSGSGCGGGGCGGGGCGGGGCGGGGCGGGGCGGG